MVSENIYIYLKTDLFRSHFITSSVNRKQETMHRYHFWYTGEAKFLTIHVALMPPIEYS